MTTVQLYESVQIKLNASGNGTAKIGPVSARESWNPATVSVSVATKTNEAQCSIYVGDAATGRNFLDGTYSGSSGDSTDRVTGVKIKVGHYVWAVCSGGYAAATATLTVTGTKEV